MAASDSTKAFRLCTTCGQTKPADEFPKDPTHRRCKACKSASAKASYRRNPEKVKAQTKRWAAANTEKVRAAASRRSATYRAKNREQRNADARVRYHANRAKRRAYAREKARQRRQNDPEMVKRRYWSNPEKYRAAAKAYVKARPGIYKRRYHANRERYLEKARIHGNVRRARKRGAAVAPIDYDRIRQRDKMRCHICRKKVKPEELHFDHVIPLAKGGAHVESNIAVAHKKCNLVKHTKVLTLF